MQFHSSITDQENARDAVDRLIDDSRNATGGRIDVAFLFITAHFRADAEEILERVWLELDPQAVVGCSAEGVIGADREIERAPGMSILVGEMPGVRIHPFHLATADWEEVLGDPDSLVDQIGHGPE